MNRRVALAQVCALAVFVSIIVLEGALVLPFLPHDFDWGKGMDDFMLISMGLAFIPLAIALVAVVVALKLIWFSAMIPAAIVFSLLSRPKPDNRTLAQILAQQRGTPGRDGI